MHESCALLQGAVSEWASLSENVKPYNIISQQRGVTFPESINLGSTLQHEIPMTFRGETWLTYLGGWTRLWCKLRPHPVLKSYNIVSQQRGVNFPSPSILVSRCMTFRGETWLTYLGGWTRLWYKLRPHPVLKSYNIISQCRGVTFPEPINLGSTLQHDIPWRNLVNILGWLDASLVQTSSSPSTEIL
ncbi:hypothetical protein J6590_065027 [Homalodisca vitripennis]|nr:hypothetical protein J6590_065027 [Homalodisca vitripennis]